jgi:tRNA dimethylallyltransferase
VPPLASRYSAFVIAGPTAVGKTELAIEFAQRCEGEIVSADAFQIYRGLDVLTAKPSRAQRDCVAHHLIGEVPLEAPFDVAQYLELAERCFAGIRARGKRPIVAGGTGLYLRALLRGLADLPPANAELRAELEAQPLSTLRDRLAALDPEAVAAIDLRNPRRVVRALEVCLLTGRPFSSFREEWRSEPLPGAGVFLMREREELYRRVDARTEAMFAAAVVEEVRCAPPTGPTASQILGLREIRAHLAGEMSREQCVSAIQAATRHYAKRQITWFRKEAGLTEIRLPMSDAADVMMKEMERRS